MNRCLSLLLTCIVSVSLLALSGCTSKACKVTGVIKMDGEPIEGVSISFVPKTDGQGELAAGTSVAGGAYEIKTLSGDIVDGTVPGTYTVVLRKSEVLWDGKSWMHPAGGGEPVKSTTLKELLPKQYTSSATSPFTATVEKGKPNTFDFDIKSK